MVVDGDVEAHVGLKVAQGKRRSSVAARCR